MDVGGSVGGDVRGGARASIGGGAVGAIVGGARASRAVRGGAAAKRAVEDARAVSGVRTVLRANFWCLTPGEMVGTMTVVAAEGFDRDAVGDAVRNAIVGAGSPSPSWRCAERRKNTTRVWEWRRVVKVS